MRSSVTRWGLALLASASLSSRTLALDWLQPVEPNQPGDAAWYLRIGADGKSTRAERLLVAPFQDVWIERSAVPLRPRAAARDEFWDRALRADRSALLELPHYRVVEVGEFAAALPSSVRAIDHPTARVEAQQRSLTDPVLGAARTRELSWTEIESEAWPLDFQKVLLASPHDSSPAFAYQNGQWFTTWDGIAPLAGGREDHWFAPALLVGDQLMRPAPLAATTAFERTADGVTVPVWTVEWQSGAARVTQRLFSHPDPSGRPVVWVELAMTNAPAGARLALGLGRRPSSHYWDEVKTNGARSPAPWFSVEPGYVADAGVVRDAARRVVLAASTPFRFEALGPLESLLVFDGAQVVLTTPQTAGAEEPAPPTGEKFAAAHEAVTKQWAAELRAGARVRLPSAEWQTRIDAWRTQVEQITRVRYEGRDRLAYGAYFYQAYFGIEEGWPPVALALWGRGEEAKRQAAIMLETENLDKANVHHQSRNGVAPWVASSVALLTGDRAWLERMAPAMSACAQWTETVRHAAQESRPPTLRGLLPPHIYGGDVRDPATSLYATTACWRGMQATADAFRVLGSDALQREGDAWAERADALRARLSGVFADVTVRGSPDFVPLALALPSLGGGNEGPYDRLTATKYGNYWNLFAPSFLELGFEAVGGVELPNRAVHDFAAARGGLWAGLPRFYDGLDAAYAIGYVGHRLEQSTGDASQRTVAVNALQAYLLHAASRNGYTIPEVAGLFPERLQRAAFEELVREAPWHVGMYDADRYLAGHISFTEPLGAGAGEALILLRRALLDETRDARGRSDGGLVVLPSVPADWFQPGQEIVLEAMPTYYGEFSATIRTESDRRVVMRYRFQPAERAIVPLRTLRLRVVGPDGSVREVECQPAAEGVATVEW